jgi:hypothetical protein
VAKSHRNRLKIAKFQEQTVFYGPWNPYIYVIYTSFHGGHPPPPLSRSWFYTDAIFEFIWVSRLLSHPYNPLLTYFYFGY